MGSSGGAFIVPANLPVPVASAGALTPFNVANYGFDNQGNDVNAGPWTALMNDLKALAHPRGARIIFPAGDFCLNNAVLDTTDLTLNGGVIIEGQGDATRIFPGGGQGRALTIIGSGSPQDHPLIQNLRLGYATELPAPPDRPYSQPILELRRCYGFLLTRVHGYLGIGDGSKDATGTILYFNDSYEGALENCWFEPGKYGVPIMFDLATDIADQADSIALRSVLVTGEYGPIFNSGCNTLEYDEVKCVKESTSTSFESSLAATANAGDITITLHAGDGASFAVGDSIAIDTAQDTGQAPGNVNGTGLEVNKVTAIAGDVLTLAQPLQYPHNIARHIQVVRGGIATSLPHVIGFRLQNFHSENYDTGILANNGNGLELENNSHQNVRFLRIVGSLSDVHIGQTIAVGGPTSGVTSNIIVDVPSWSTGTPLRLAIDGPLVNIAGINPTVNYKGTSYTIDTLGYYALALTASFAVSVFNPYGIKLGRDGLRMRGLLTMAGAVAAQTAITTLPPHLVPRRSALVSVWQTNSQSKTATPAPNTLWVEGSDQANPGQIQMMIASTAAGWLSLDSVPLVTVH